MHMRFAGVATFVSLVASLVKAAPVTPDTRVTEDQPFGISEAQVLQILPSTASCGDTGPDSECRTADVIAEFTTKSFSKNGFMTPGEQAALFSLMAFESGFFQFDTNQSKNPGQGTRNMMQFNFVLPYALQFNGQAVAAIDPTLNAGSTPDDVRSDEEKNQIRATVLSDELSFNSAAWFLRNNCTPSISEALKSESVEAYQDYLGTGCINVGEIQQERLDLFAKTLEVLKGSA